MADIAEIARDPRWLPHTLDLAGGRMLFVRISRDDLTGAGFLADVKPEEAGGAEWLPLDSVRTMAVEAGPLHFIFHTAFCRSTLLARAMNVDGVSVGMAEPGILAQLAGAGDRARELVKPVCDLLSRSWGEGEAVFVKPTNHANMLIPALLAARPDAKAVLMTNPLPSFLAAVVRKGMMGRRWARTLYLEMMGYAGMDLGLDAREQFAMTDLQAGALAWFLNQRYLDALVRQFGDRVRVLDGDAFGAEPAKVLEAVGRFTGVGIDAARAAEIASGPVFTRDAKTGLDYAEKSARDAAATQSAVVEDEIAKLGEWVGAIAAQAGVEVPLRQTLI